MAKEKQEANVEPAAVPGEEPSYFERRARATADLLKEKGVLDADEVRLSLIHI